MKSENHKAKRINQENMHLEYFSVNYLYTLDDSVKHLTAYTKPRGGAISENLIELVALRRELTSSAPEGQRVPKQLIAGRTP